MKKVLAITMATALLGATALAADVAPYHTIDINDLSDAKLHVVIEAEKITDSGVTVSVYDNDTYAVADVDQLAEGDVLHASQGDVTVSSVTKNGTAVDVNGGSDNNGVTLTYDDHDKVYYEQDFEFYADTKIGDVELTYAPEVQFNVYKMNDDLSIAGEGYDTVKVPAAEAGAKLKAICDKLGDLSEHAATVQVKNGQIVSVTVDYTP